MTILQTLLCRCGPIGQRVYILLEVIRSLYSLPEERFRLGSSIATA